ncbi:putative Acyltransferase, partial [Pseudomonas syringae pv. berberidis]
MDAAQAGRAAATARAGRVHRASVVLAGRFHLSLSLAVLCPIGIVMFEPLVATIITAGARSITGARSLWLGCTPELRQRIYFANHSSHGDFVLLWASLPPALRKTARPVAGADYWQTSPLRRYIINRVFNGVLVDRKRSTPESNPLQPMLEALENGDSLIFFPEGTRNPEDGLLPFKSG